MRTLHLYLARELLKNFLMTSVVLTLLVVMGGGVANIFKGEGVSPEEVAKVFAFLIPVAITLILPIAALFSATITYGRAAMDNEITACRAAGINIHKLLLSAAFLGGFVTICTYWSWNFMIPSLSQSIDDITRRDLPKIVLSQFQKARPLVFGKYRMLAKRCESLENDRLPPNTPPDHTFLLLTGVAFLEVEDQEVLRYGTAEVTIIDFNKGERTPKVTADLQDVRAFDAGRRQYYELKHQILGPFEIPLPMRRKIKFENLATLMEYRKDPQKIPDIEGRLAGLRRSLMAYFLYESVIDNIVTERGGKGVFRLVGKKYDYDISAGKYDVNPDDGRPLLGSVHILERPHGAPADKASRGLTADKTLFEVRSSIDPDRPQVLVRLTGNVEIQSLPRGPDQRSIRKDTYELDMVDYMEQPMLVEKYNSLSIATLLQGDAKGRMPPSQSRQLERLIERIRRAGAEVGGEIHFRASYALSSIAVVVFGAVLGIIVRGGQVLTAFGISCIPSLFVVLSSIVGRNMADRPQHAMLSIGIMWGATLFIYLACGFVATKVLKR